MAEEGVINELWEGGSCCMSGGVRLIPRSKDGMTAQEMTVGWVDERQTQDKEAGWVVGWWGKEMDVGWVKGWWA